MANAERPCPRRWLKSNSRPTTNNNRISPNWLSTAKVSPKAGSKTAWETRGKNQPKHDGPRTNPAAISPTTDGCRNLRKIAAKTRAATMMTINWSSAVRSNSSVFMVPMDAASMRMAMTTNSPIEMDRKTPL